MLFQGLTDQTLAHDQRWLFAQLGKYLERIDVTCRVIETKFTILHTAGSQLEGALQNIHWMAVSAELLLDRGLSPASRRRHGPAARGRVPDSRAQLPAQHPLCGGEWPTRRSPRSAPK